MFEERTVGVPILMSAYEADTCKMLLEKKQGQEFLELSSNSITYLKIFLKSKKQIDHTSLNFPIQCTNYF